MISVDAAFDWLRFYQRFDLEYCNWQIYAPTAQDASW
jgi:hypothetical protein